MKPLIVIIEDEADLLELLEYRLKKEGFRVEGFLSTKNVERFMEEESVDLMIVDRNLPGVEGSEFVKKLRDKGCEIPVLFLSAKVSESDIELGFLRGGDDYMKKPFNINELILRVKAILKRTKKEVKEIRFKDIKLNIDRQEAYVEDKKIELTKLEFDLLYTFLKNKSSVLTREFLIENVWNEDIPNEKSVNVAIKRLKEKIDPKKEKNYIEAVRGVGYRLCLD